MIKEYERVVIAVDLPQYQLKQGDVGVVVMIHGNHEGYELEIINAQGKTLDVVTVEAHEVRALEARDMLHVRPMLEKIG